MESFFFFPNFLMKRLIFLFFFFFFFIRLIFGIFFFISQSTCFSSLFSLFLFVLGLFLLSFFSSSFQQMALLGRYIHSSALPVLGLLMISVAGGSAYATHHFLNNSSSLHHHHNAEVVNYTTRADRPTNGVPRKLLINTRAQVEERKDTRVI